MARADAVQLFLFHRRQWCDAEAFERARRGSHHRARAVAGGKRTDAAGQRGAEQGERGSQHADLATTCTSTSALKVSRRRGYIDESLQGAVLKNTETPWGTSGSGATSDRGSQAEGPTSDSCFFVG